MTTTREFRVYGPPGTGKTRYLSEQSAHAVEKYGMGGVVIASLTRAAAAEIAGRTESVVRRSNVGTLHAHAYRALDRPALADTDEGLRAFNEAMPGRFELSGGRPFDPDVAPTEALAGRTEADEAMLSLMALRANMTPRELWPHSVGRFAAVWDDFKAQTGRVDFTDLIERAALETGVHPSKPAVFLVDEAQDLSRLELTLARRWGGECEVFVIVGDPDQNLYEWRGSDPAAFAEHDAEGVKVLSRSWRVPEAVRDYALRWIERVPDREPIAYEPTDEAGEVVRSRANFKTADALLHEVERETEQGRSVMVLGSCGFHVAPLVAAMRDRGVPFHNPYAPTHGGWNPLRHADRVLAYLKPHPDVDGGMWTFPDVWKWTEHMVAKGNLKRGSKSMIEHRAREDRFGEEDERPTDLQTLARLFEEDALMRAVDLDLEWLTRATLASKRRVIEYPAAVAQRHGAAKLTDAPKVIVGTIHSVKGGEADTVFLLPDLSPQGYRSWVSRRTRSRIIRQYYVGMTRARHKLVIAPPASSTYVPLP